MVVSDYIRPLLAVTATMGDVMSRQMNCPSAVIISWACWSSRA
jgi:hypothetical protein